MCQIISQKLKHGAMKRQVIIMATVNDYDSYKYNV